MKLLQKQTHILPFIAIMIFLFNSIDAQQSIPHLSEYDYTCTIVEQGVTKRFRWNAGPSGEQWGTTGAYDIDEWDGTTWVHKSDGTGGNSSVLEGECTVA
ncbi:MAG: hypothetical protein AAFN93_19215 [Bacteroidota bacterium]